MSVFSFFAPSRAQWYPVGLVSSFPEVGEDDGHLAEKRSCGDVQRPGCKVFRIPRTSPDETSVDEVDPSETGIDLGDQVLVFKHRGKMHAVDNQCPHSAFPLSEGTPFDIEDFGLVLSAGITCPKHGWSFDIFTGTADRGNYKLAIWEVQLRDIKDKDAARSDGGTPDQEVWVRRKQRIG